MTSTLETILLPTLERIRSLYASTAGVCAGRMRALVVKPGWNVVLGTEGQHGAAMNFGGYESPRSTRTRSEHGWVCRCSTSQNWRCGVQAGTNDRRHRVAERALAAVPDTERPHCTGHRSSGP